MKIINNNKKPLTNFYDLKDGDVFFSYTTNCYYMKISSSRNVNVLNLKHFVAFSFDDFDQRLQKVDAEIHIL